MGSYYSTGKTLRNIDSLIVAALIVAYGITDPATVEAVTAGEYFAVDTDAGELVVHFDPGFTPDLVGKRGKVGLPGSVFGRFTTPNPDVAESNPFSGKWNFHFSEANVDSQIYNMVARIKYLNPRNLRIVDDNYSFRNRPLLDGNDEV